MEHPDKVDIPKKAIYRLSTYLRCLQKLEQNNIQTVSSETLAKASGVKPSQLRKDLAYFGQLGTRGIGYSIHELIHKLCQTLGRAQLQPVILVGAGNLGSALLRYSGFEKEGFEVVAAFDASPEIAIQRGVHIPVHHDRELESFIKQNQIRIAILCVPAEYAQLITNRLVSSGIQGILNFSPLLLEVPKEVTVNRVDLAMELEHLGYFVR